MQNNDNSFSYSFSARERAEIKKIRNKYEAQCAPDTDKLELIRRLDSSVQRKATISAVILGTLSALIMGTGMSLVMTELGSALGSLALPIGIGAGLIGIAGVILAYPLYGTVLRRERKKAAPEIIRLSDELMEQ